MFDCDLDDASRLEGGSEDASHDDLLEGICHRDAPQRRNERKQTVSHLSLFGNTDTETRVLWGDHGRPSSSADICCLYPRPAESHGNSAKEQHERREDSAGQSRTRAETRSDSARKDATGRKRAENRVDDSTEGVRVMIADSLQVGSDSGRRGSATLSLATRQGN